MLFPGVTELMAQTAADFQLMAERQWLQYGSYRLAGNWVVPCGNHRFQIVAVPAHLHAPDPRIFGVGWVPSPYNEDPRWRTFVRNLNEWSAIDFSEYPPLPAEVQLAWSQYRYQGLPRLR